MPTMAELTCPGFGHSVPATGFYQSPYSSVFIHVTLGVRLDTCGRECMHRWRPGKGTRRPVLSLSAVFL